jgi:hypothetical protein
MPPRAIYVHDRGAVSGARAGLEALSVGTGVLKLASKTTLVRRRIARPQLLKECSLIPRVPALRDLSACEPEPGHTPEPSGATRRSEAQRVTQMGRAGAPTNDDDVALGQRLFHRNPEVRKGSQKRRPNPAKLGGAAYLSALHMADRALGEEVVDRLLSTLIPNLLEPANREPSVYLGHETSLIHLGLLSSLTRYTQGLGLEQDAFLASLFASEREDSGK